MVEGGAEVIKTFLAGNKADGSPLVDSLIITTASKTLGTNATGYGIDLKIDLDASTEIEVSISLVR